MKKKKNDREINDLQLLFMWIRGKEGEELNGIEYRFSSEFNIIFNPKNINEHGVILFDLEIIKSPDYIPFFFGKNVKSLTTIVGANGSGKTELLKEISRYDSKNFYLFFDGGKYLWFGNYSTLSKKDNLRHTKKIPNNLQKFYYYSPSYIGNQFKGNIGLVDFSINRIAGDDFPTDESLSQIKFLSSKEGKKFLRLLKFNKEVVANVNILKYQVTDWIKKDLSSLSIICKSLHRHSHLLYNESNRNNNSNDRLLHYLFFLETITLIKAFKDFEVSTQGRFTTELNVMESEWRKIEKEKLSLLDYLITIIGKNLLSGLKGNNFANNYRRKMVDTMTKTKASLLFYKKYFSKENIEFKPISIDGRSYYNFSLRMSDKDSIELLNCIKNINFFESKHVLIHWRYMSYGQRTFLNLFSLLYPIVKGSRSILRLMIDEGELGFHPEWQRNYINILLSFLNSSIVNSKIQLILTTHSPLILSDIPINNIIFLKKNETPFEGKQTFSQNIHTILYDSFFLNKSGTIGAFAKRKIRMLISEITKMQKNQGKNAEIEKTISIIGEPILRKAVEDMYFEKLSNASKKEKLLEQLKQLEEEEQMQND